MWRFCVGAGITTLFMEVTPRVLPLYRRLGWPLSIRGPPRCHWGEDCFLSTLGIVEIAQALLQRSEHSSLYRRIIAQAFRVRPAPERAKPSAAAAHAEGRGGSLLVEMGDGS